MIDRRAKTDSIPYWDYRAHIRDQRAALRKAMDDVLESGRLILGPRVERFERRFASYCGAAYGVGVNSGTDALVLALKALSVGPGDEVITAANTAIPTVAAIRAAGAQPVLVDVEPDTFLLDVDRVAEALTPRTRCILPVHLCGQAADMTALSDLVAGREIPLVEDCAQAAGALYQGRPVGSLGAIGAFSFYPTKVLGAFGDAGMAVTSRPELASRLRRLRFYGIEDGYHAEEEGYNSRLDELQAAFLELRLSRLEGAVQRRTEIANAYAEGLSGVGDLRLPTTRADRSHQFYLYTIRTERRDALKAYLAEAGVETRINYAVPVHLMRGYEFLGYGPGTFPITERLTREILSLPLYPGLPDGDVCRVVAAVRAFFE